jgi:hypothetical protein
MSDFHEPSEQRPQLSLQRRERILHYRGVDADLGDRQGPRSRRQRPLNHRLRVARTDDE